LRWTSAGEGSASGLDRIDPASGESVWENSPVFADPVTPHLVDGWVLAEADGEIRCFDSKTGGQRWSRPADRFIGLAGGEALVAADDGQVSALKAATGGLKYQFKIELAGFSDAQFSLGAKTLYVLAGQDLAAYSLAKDTPELWRLDLPDLEDSAGYRLHHVGDRLWLQAGGDIRPVV
jgi:outer membrane protein assembly factor BamB